MTNQQYLVNRKKLLITAVSLIGTLLIYDTIKTIIGVNESYDDKDLTTLFPKSTINLFNNVDIMLVVNLALQLIFIIVALKYWNEYNISRTMMFISSVFFIFVPLTFYYIPYASLTECSNTYLDMTLRNIGDILTKNSTINIPDGVYTNIESNLQPYYQKVCDYLIEISILRYLPTITTSAMIIFPAIMNACNIIAEEFGRMPEIEVLRKIICYGFIPISAIVFGVLWQFTEYVPFVILEIAIITYLIVIAMNKHKYINYTVLTFVLVMAFVIVIHYEINILNLIFRGAVRYIYSITLYKDIIVYIVSYIHKSREDNTYNKLEETFNEDAIVEEKEMVNV